MAAILGFVLVLAALAVAVLGVGWLLPVKHRCARSAVFKQPPQAVWALVTAPAAYPDWRKDARHVEVLSGESGRLRWRESGGERPLTFEVIASQPETRWSIRIVDAGLPFSGVWIFDLVPDGAGCRLSIREEGEIYSPFFRFMARFVFGYHRTLEAYLRAVAAHFGETVRVEVAPTWG